MQALGVIMGLLGAIGFPLAWVTTVICGIIAMGKLFGVASLQGFHYWPLIVISVVAWIVAVIFFIVGSALATLR